MLLLFPIQRGRNMRSWFGHCSVIIQLEFCIKPWSNSLKCNLYTQHFFTFSFCTQVFEDRREFVLCHKSMKYFQVRIYRMTCSQQQYWLWLVVSVILHQSFIYIITSSISMCIVYSIFFIILSEDDDKSLVFVIFPCRHSPWSSDSKWMESFEQVFKMLTKYFVSFRNFYHLGTSFMFLL